MNKLNKKAISNWLNAAVAPEDREVLTAREVAELDQALVAAGGSAQLLVLAGGEQAIAAYTAEVSK